MSLAAIALAGVTAPAALISIGRIPDPARTRIGGIWQRCHRASPSPLSDVFIRTCDGGCLSCSTRRTSNPAPQFESCRASITAMAAYILSAAGRIVGRKPFVIATFVSSLFPVAVT